MILLSCEGMWSKAALKPLACPSQFTDIFLFVLSGRMGDTYPTLPDKMWLAFEGTGELSAHCP